MPVRPCLLIVDPAVEGGVSSRKLVLESAMFNVIASYSCQEAMDTLERFPRVHAVIVNAVMHESECLTLLRDIRETYPGPVRIVVGKLDRDKTPDADHYVESYSPKVLLQTLHAIFPQQGGFEKEPSHGFDVATASF